jgi:hypothetical protein
MQMHVRSDGKAALANVQAMQLRLHLPPAAVVPPPWLPHRRLDCSLQHITSPPWLPVSQGSAQAAGEKWPISLLLSERAGGMSGKFEAMRPAAGRPARRTSQFRLPTETKTVLMVIAIPPDFDF